MPFRLLFATETIEICGVWLPYHMPFHYSVPTDHRFYRRYMDICVQNLFLPNKSRNYKNYAFQYSGLSAFHFFSNSFGF